MVVFFSVPLVFLVLISSLLGASCENVFMLWGLMELNMLSFLGVVVVAQQKHGKGGALLYLFVQSSSSLMFLGFVFLTPWLGSNSVSMMFLAMLIKLGAAPSHVWFLALLEKLTLDSAFLLLSVQKILPLFALSFLFTASPLFSLLSAVTGALGGILGMNILHLLGYSSLVNLGWMMAISSNTPLMVFYVVLYSASLFPLMAALSGEGGVTLANSWLLSKGGTMSLNFIFGILSLSGIPPFLGFLAKILGLNELLGFTIFVSLALVGLSGLMLVPYLRVLFSFLKQFASAPIYASGSGVGPFWLILMTSFLYFV